MSANNVFEVTCANCDSEVEFIAGEKQRRCPHCGQIVANPKLVPKDTK